MELQSQRLQPRHDEAERPKTQNLDQENRNRDACEAFCPGEEKVNRLKSEVAEAEGLGDLFKALSDETRAKIVYCLSKEELCVCTVADIMGMSVQAVSHHLRLLRAMKLVKYRKEGKLAFYSLDDQHVANLLREGLKHLREMR